MPEGTDEARQPRVAAGPRRPRGHGLVESELEAAAKKMRASRARPMQTGLRRTSAQLGRARGPHCGRETRFPTISPHWAIEFCN